MVILLSCLVSIYGLGDICIALNLEQRSVLLQCLVVNAETHAVQSMENKLLWVLSCWWDVYNKSPYTSFSMQLVTLKGGVKY